MTELICRYNDLPTVLPAVEVGNKIEEHSRGIEEIKEDQGWQE